MADAGDIATTPHRRRRLRPIRIALALVGLLLGALVLLAVVDKGDGLGLVDGATPGSYLAIFGLIAAGRSSPARRR